MCSLFFWIRKILKQKGIKQAYVNLIMNNASIEYDDNILKLEDVEKFIEKAGFLSLGIDRFEKEEKKKNNEKIKLIGITIISIIIYINVTYDWTTRNFIFRYDEISY